MSPVWEVPCDREAFTAPIDKRLKELLTIFKAPPKEEAEFQQLDEEWRDLRAFVTAVREVKISREPITLLKPAVDEQGRPVENHYQKSVGDWTAYYEVDHRFHVCAGVLVVWKQEPIPGGLIAALQSAQKSFSSPKIEGK
jgi:hypothetical protein